jgi:hypothetical protein
MPSWRTGRSTRGPAPSVDAGIGPAARPDCWQDQAARVSGDSPPEKNLLAPRLHPHQARCHLPTAGIAALSAQSARPTTGPRLRLLGPANAVHPPQKSRPGLVGFLQEIFLPPSPPAEKATARQDQTGKTSTSDRSWRRRGR